MPDPLDYLLFDENKWRRIITENAGPEVQALLAEGAAKGIDVIRDLGLSIEGVFELESPQVQAFLKDYTFKFARSISDTAADRLRSIIGEGLAEGASMRELEKRILADPVIGPASDAYRAEMIARTEANRAENAGAERVWVEANKDAIRNGQAVPFSGERWRTQPDACKFCVSMDGRVSGFGEAYYKVGDVMEVGDSRMKFSYEDVERPPLHPMCRCALEPVVAPEYREPVERPIEVTPTGALPTFITLKAAEDYAKQHFGIQEIHYRGGGRFGADLRSDRKRLAHLEMMLREWNRLRNVYADMPEKPVHTLWVTAPKRSRASIDTPQAQLSSQATPWTEAEWAQIRHWEKENGRVWTWIQPDTELADVFRHELAHTLSTREVIKAFPRQFSLTWLRDNVSEYAGTKRTEAIAEVFTMATHIRYVRGTLPEALEAFVFRVMLGGV